MHKHLEAEGEILSFLERNRHYLPSMINSESINPIHQASGAVRIFFFFQQILNNQKTDTELLHIVHWGQSGLLGNSHFKNVIQTLDCPFQH